MEKKVCKKCGKELPEDRNEKLCEECREKRNSLFSRMMIGVGAAGVAAVAIIFSIAGGSKKEDDIDNNNDEPMKNDDLPSGGKPYRNYYNGYVPVGCRACGGNYPYCKDGCPLFDDD